MQLDLKLILGIIGNATATALFLSPMPTFMYIFKKKSTQEFSGLPYVCTLFNCVLWVLYGMPFVKPHCMLIVTINGFGTALEIAYLAIYLTYATKEKRLYILRLLMGVIVMYSMVIFVVAFALHSPPTRQLVVGSLCVVVATLMYASPLSVMGLVIRTRSVEYMPFLLSLFNFINSGVWSAYSLVTKDIFVAIPNGLGCLCAIAQLAIYAIYKNAIPLPQHKLDEKEGKPNMEGAVYVSMQKNVDDHKSVAPPSKMPTPLRSQQTTKPLSDSDSLASSV